jgi:exodeoxyribonuclease V beta subunit
VKRLSPLSIPLVGTSLIEASAGTGKTHTITTLFLRLLLEQRLPIDRILVVTFTKAATAELRDRLRRRLVEACHVLEGRGDEGELGELARQSRDPAGALARARAALSAFDRARVFTIHGFCQRALADFAFESGSRFDLELVADQRHLLRELVADFWAAELHAASRAEIVHLKRARVGLERWLRLGSLVLAFPELALLPAPAPDVVTAAPVRRYLAARERARAGFPARAGEIVALLGDKRRMNQTSYKLERLPERMEALEALLARTDASLDGWDDFFDKLKPDALRSGTRKGAEPPQHEFFEMMAELGAARADAQAALERWRVALEHRLAGRVREDMLDKKLSAGVQSFDDLLQGLRRALDSERGKQLASEIARRYSAVLVDEFQDTDPVQYGIFRRIWGRGGALFLVGDPKQAIYSFRGADIFSYLGAARDAGEARYTLGVNRRADPGLVSVSNTLFARARAPFVLEGIEYSEVEAAPDARNRLERDGRPCPAFDVALVVDPSAAGRDGRMNKPKDQLADSVAALVARDLGARIRIDGEPLDPGRIAILTRTNQQAFEIQSALRALAIPSVLLGDKSVLDSDEAPELALILRAMAMPSNERALLCALSTALFGRDAGDLALLREDATRFEVEVDGFRRWHALWTAHGFIHAFRAMLSDAAVAARLLGLPDGERRLTNLGHLAELLHSASVKEHLGMTGLRRWFDDVRLDPHAREELAPDTQQLRLESDSRAVKLTTMHKSKGLEFDLVYAPFLWDSGERRSGDVLTPFHDPAAGHRPSVSLLEPGEAERNQIKLEQRAENMRLAYVALTRARHRVCVAWGRFRVGSASPLAALLHAPDPGDARDAGQIVQAFPDVAALRQDLRRLEAAAGGALEVSEVPEQAERHVPPASMQGELEARPLPRRVDVGNRISSFSALTAGAELGVVQQPARDVDQGTGRGVPLLDLDDDARIRLHALPRGAKAGDALHELFEHVDFGIRDLGELERAAERALERHGFAASWAPEVAAAARDVLATPIAEGLTLSDVPRACRLSELEFAFPVALGDAGRLTPRALGRVFEAHPKGLPERYAASVAALGFAPLRGYLRGFVDLVFEHAGRVYVVDYKSNFLGVRPADYVPGRLAMAMAEHHYYLQYHLYALAVLRHFAARSSGAWSYERNFGGVFYLFLRGMAPERGAATGVYFERPPAARLAALSALVGERERAA